MNSVSVILPTFNEAENIIPLIVSLQKNVKGLCEILIVDDNSKDNTGKIALKWAAIHKQTQVVRVIIRLTDNGLQKSITEGIQAARGNIIVWMDADFSHPPEIINQLTKSITNGDDIAVASRYITGGKSKSHTASESKAAIWVSTRANVIMGKLFQVPFHDFTSGFVAVKRRAIQSLPLTGSYGEYFIDFIIRAYAKGYTIVEIPFDSPPRSKGESKTAPNIFVLLKRFYQYGVIITSLLWKNR